MNANALVDMHVQIKRAVPSSYMPGYTHAVGAWVMLVEELHAETGLWAVEFRVPDEALVGGAWYETLEMRLEDLELLVGAILGLVDALPVCHAEPSHGTKAEITRGRFSRPATCTDEYGHPMCDEHSSRLDLPRDLPYAPALRAVLSLIKHIDRRPPGHGSLF